LAQPVHRLMLTEAAQFEMADLKDRRRNFHGESISHEKRLADYVLIPVFIASVALMIFALVRRRRSCAAKTPEPT